MLFSIVGNASYEHLFLAFRPSHTKARTVYPTLLNK